MAYSIRVSLPGYNALTDTNPDHFALKSDLNDILIKEYTRGTITVPANTTIPITHNFGYVPFFIVFYYEINQPNLKYYVHGVNNDFINSNINAYSNANQLFFRNLHWGTYPPIVVHYYIFYDNAI